MAMVELLNLSSYLLVLPTENNLPDAIILHPEKTLAMTSTHRSSPGPA